MNKEDNKPTLPYGWVVKQSKSYPDRVYYFNVTTGASTWEMPDLIKPYLAPHHKSTENTNNGKTKVHSEKKPNQWGMPPRINNPGPLPPKDKGRPVTVLPPVEARFSPEPQFSPEVDSDGSTTPRPYDEAYDDDLYLDNAPYQTGHKSYDVSNHHITQYSGNKSNFMVPGYHDNKEFSNAVHTANLVPNNSVSASKTAGKKNLTQNQSKQIDTSSAKVKSKNVISNLPNQKKEVPKLVSTISNSSIKSDKSQRKEPIKTEKTDSLKTESKKRKCSDESGTGSSVVNSSKQSIPSKKKKVENKKSPTKTKGSAKLNKKTEKDKSKSSDVRKVVQSDSLLCSLSDLKDDDPCHRDRTHSGESSVHSVKTAHLSDPEKIKSIQSWINQCEAGDPPSDPFLDDPDKCSTVSTSDTKRTSPDSGSISVTYGAEMDNRRVVIATEKSSLRTGDSGYSASTSMTLPHGSTFLRKVMHTLNSNNNAGGNNPWKGAHAEAPPVGQNREIMDMEIDEVQHELNEVEDNQEEDMEVCEIAVKEVREYLKKCPDEIIGKLTESYSKERHINTSQLPNVTESLLIIVDTNVWIDDLGFLEDLRDQPLSGYGCPILVVPWVVMQELDALKNRKSVLNLSLATEKKARAPVNYLYHCFEQKHPRILAQTGQQACEAVESFPAENNDDRILQCCLQCKQNYTQSRTVLLTNDKHLISKATVLGIEAYNKQKLLPGLQGKPSTKMKVIDKSSSTSTNNNKVLLKESPDKMVDETYCKIKVLMKTALSIVLEQEMKSAYEDMWLQIVCRKPPWTLTDVLECFKKHWLAVFGQIYRRSLKENVEKLCDIFNPFKESFIVSKENVENMLNDALLILEECNRVADYGLQFKEAVREMKSLKPQLQKYYKKTSPEKSDNQQASTSTGTVDSPQSPSQTHHLQLVAQAKFDRIWQIIHNCCSAHQQYLESGNRDKQHDHEAVTLLTKLVTVIKDLRYHYSISLTYSPAEIQQKSAIVHDVYVLVNSFFLRLDMENEDSIALEHVQSLFGDPDKRTLLQTGLDQLDEMIKKLYKYVIMMPD